MKVSSFIHSMFYVTIDFCVSVLKECDIFVEILERMLKGLTKCNDSLSAGVIHLLIVDTPGYNLSCWYCLCVKPTNQPT